MDIDAAKEEVLKNIQWLNGPPESLGGQSCGVIHRKQVLYSSDLDIRIEIGFHRSVLKNKELAIELLLRAVEKVME